MFTILAGVIIVPYVTTTGVDSFIPYTKWVRVRINLKKVETDGFRREIVNCRVLGQKS